MTNPDLADLEKVRDKLVEASLRFWSIHRLDENAALSEECILAADALRTARESVAQPKVCEPPEEFRAHKWHWLLDQTTPFPVMWHNEEWYAPGSDTIDGYAAARFGWTYLAPALPPAEPVARDCDRFAKLAPEATPELPAAYSAQLSGKSIDGQIADEVARSTPTVAKEPTDEAMRTFMAMNWKVDDEEAIDLVRAALTHFSPPGREISDEEIIGLGVSYRFIERNLGPYTIENQRFIDCCRDLLAKASPTPSTTTLGALYDLARKTAREAFHRDARVMLEGRR